MKDAINEIIDYLGNDKNYNCDCNDGSYYLELPYREAHELKDCITNLQEKYDKALEDSDKKVHKLMAIRKYLKANEREYGSLEDNEKIILGIIEGK